LQELVRWAWLPDPVGDHPYRVPGIEQPGVDEHAVGLVHVRTLSGDQVLRQDVRAGAGADGGFGIFGRTATSC
jgi:hypothetical protein